MARKLTAFEKQCTTINNRMSGHPCERVAMQIYRQVFQPGLIFRKYRSKYHPMKHYCSECGAQIGVATQKECPVCHAKWTAETKEDTRRWERSYHMEMEAKGDIQVCRIYRVERFVRMTHEKQYCVWEVERIMYAPDGRRCVFAKGVSTMCGYYDAFSRWGDLKLRREHGTMTWSAINRYNLDIYSWHIRSLTQQWQYKDIPALLEDFKGDTGVLKIIAHPWAETLRKAGHERLFRYLVKGLRLLTKEQIRAINICSRNHYVPKDYSLWLDYLKMLKDLHLDTHNAHYLCPADLMAAHDEMLTRLNRNRDRQRIEKKMQAIGDEDRQAYVKRMGGLLTVKLTADNLSVHTLQSVDEFADEGIHMHHCVFDLGYYKRPNVMIMSARDGDGHRLATIEYNLASQNIVQCRAACNKVPERDAEIRQLITSHRADFQRLLKAA